MKRLMLCLVALSVISAGQAFAQTSSPVLPKKSGPLKIEVDTNYLAGILNGGPFGIAIDRDGSISTSPDIDPTKKLKIASVKDSRPTDGPLVITFTDGSKLTQTSGYSMEGFIHIYYDDGPRGFRVELFAQPRLSVRARGAK